MLAACLAGYEPKWGQELSHNKVLLDRWCQGEFNFSKQSHRDLETFCVGLVRFENDFEWFQIQTELKLGSSGGCQGNFNFRNGYVEAWNFFCGRFRSMSRWLSEYSKLLVDLVAMVTLSPLKRGKFVVPNIIIEFCAQYVRLVFYFLELLIIIIRNSVKLLQCNIFEAGKSTTGEQPMVYHGPNLSC